LTNFIWSESLPIFLFCRKLLDQRLKHVGVISCALDFVCNIVFVCTQFYSQLVAWMLALCRHFKAATRTLWNFVRAKPT